MKKFLTLLCFALLSVLVLTACGKPAKTEHTVKMSTDGQYYQTGTYEIFREDGMANIVDYTNNIHKYENNTSIKIRVQAPENFHIVFEDLNAGVVANSKDWFEASQQTKEEVTSTIMEKVLELQNLNLSNEEKAERLQADPTYTKYSPAAITWNKISKTEYVGTLKVTKNLVFEISRNVFMRDEWTLYALTEAVGFNFTATYDVNSVWFESEAKNLSNILSVVKFDIYTHLFRITIEQASEMAESYNLTKIYYTYFNSPKQTLTKQDILNADHVFEMTLTLMQDDINQPPYYVSEYFFFPESLEQSAFNNEFRYMAFYVESGLVE
ncbi:MAG: hypothetical protein ACOX6H_02925 [Christensenellales bacterium]